GIAERRHDAQPAAGDVPDLQLAVFRDSCREPTARVQGYSSHRAAKRSIERWVAQGSWRRTQIGRPKHQVVPPSSSHHCRGGNRLQTLAIPALSRSPRLLAERIGIEDEGAAAARN